MVTFGVRDGYFFIATVESEGVRIHKDAARGGRGVSGSNHKNITDQNYRLSEFKEEKKVQSHVFRQR